MKSKVYNLSDEEFREFIKQHHSWCGCARDLGMSTSGGNASYQLKKRCNELNCDTSHFNGQYDAQQASQKYTLEEIMVENSTYTNTTKFKERLIRENIIPYECALCGLKDEWNGKKLVLQLDHVNGKHNDHRKENLRFLCPNCHSQTQTFSGKNKNNAPN